MKHSLHNKGFSLIEMLIYLAVLSMIFLLVVNTVLSFTGSYRSLSALRVVEHSAIGALERMSRDIRSASNATVGLGSNNVTLQSSIEGVVSTTTRFYIDNGTLKVDVNSTYLGPLTLSNVSVTNLLFTKISTTTSSALKIDMTLQGSVGNTVQTKNYHTTVILKES